MIDDYFSACLTLPRSRSLFALPALPAPRRSMHPKAWLDHMIRTLSPSLLGIAGAEICSTPFVRSLRLTTVAAPAQKRAALALVSLESARLSHTSDALHLCLLGGWTSTLLFRCPLMSILASAHSVVSTAHVDSRKPVLGPLPWPAAQELSLLAVLSPLAQCDLAAPMDPVLYASDASEDKRGFVKASVGCHLTHPFGALPPRKVATAACLPRRRPSLQSSMILRPSPCGPSSLRLLLPRLDLWPMSLTLWRSTAAPAEVSGLGGRPFN